MYKNVVGQKAIVYAYDKTTGLPQTGDAANITAYIAKDGVASAASNDTNPTEIDNTNMPGYYAFDLTQAETNCDHFAMYAVSATPNILVSNVEAYTKPATVDANVTQVSGDSTAADNLELACDNYSATRGLAGTALPAAAADAAGGLVVSDAGGLDLDTQLANTNEITAARMGALTDWINGGRLDLLLDAIKAVTDALPNGGALTDLATAASLATVDSNVDAILADTADMQPKLGTPAGASISADIASVKTDTGSIEADTQDLQTQIGTAGAGLTDLGGMSTGMKAEVNAEVLDVMETDAISEPSQGIPSATPSMKEILAYFWMAFRNQGTATSAQMTIASDDGTVLAKATLSDNGTTFTKSEMISGA